MSGTSETAQLKQNVEEQLNRLLKQLAEIDEGYEDGELDEEEYDEMREETLEQLAEFQETLSSLMEGDMSLVDDLSAMKLAIQAAVSQAFQTPEVIELFAKKQPDALRAKYEELETQLQLGKLTEASFNAKKLEMLAAILNLGGALTDGEKAYLQKNMNETLAQFQNAATNLSASANKDLLSGAASDIARASGQS
ncbi:LZIC protein [Thecamonas trahens ATCC 50062]|uniref:LZIC protein n=1 Tax=Thecamonas trahens ATCC 50062 TaxID=461836 RepID=A0A0L0DFM2_THETB|nr:LZIC protein [Thecamonas trahens ATCC 50062]KNC50103.1 LZIC protein [Thecamonas trahens ATCC 50062]|eukprot:XP_013757262.1 LZIC protein [Thecamonas trahens ATCC 50062]